MTKCPHCGNPIRYITDTHTIFIVDTEEKTLITERGRIIKGFMLHSCPIKTQPEETASSADVAANSIHARVPEVLV